MVAAILIQTHPVLQASLLLCTATAGTLLILYPKRLIKQLGIDDMDDWGTFLMQLIGQILLGIAVTPLMYVYMYWLFL